MIKPSVNKVVLAYSGGLDTSIIVPWLKENYGCEVVCFTANVGQVDELDGLEEKALASGASQFIIHDMREEFAEEYLFPVLRAGARIEVDEGKEYANRWQVQEVVKKYSDHIAFPIYLRYMKSEYDDAGFAP